MSVRYVLALVTLASLVLLLAVPAHAMGPPPPACQNVYPATITAFSIAYPGGTLNVLADPNSTITIAPGGTYDITLTVATGGESAYGNTSLGQVWMVTTTPGFISSFCVPEGGFPPGIALMGPSQTVTMTFPDNSANGYETSQMFQKVAWYVASDIDISADSWTDQNGVLERPVGRARV